jgi:hypothetical protein
MFKGFVILSRQTEKSERRVTTLTYATSQSKHTVPAVRHLKHFDLIPDVEFDKRM